MASKKHDNAASMVNQFKLCRYTTLYCNISQPEMFIAKSPVQKSAAMDNGSDLVEVKKINSPCSSFVN